MAELAPIFLVMSTEPKTFYTLDDLRNWETVTANLSIPARLAVFGDPVEHSRSPQMHNPALEQGGKNTQYVRLHITPEELNEALQLLKEKDFIGVNVTIPHKGGVFNAVDEMTDYARMSQSVNTVLVDGDRLIGQNTDATGLEKAIRGQFAVDMSDLRVMVLGAGGGAGRAACVAATMNLSERLVLVNRTVEKAQALKAELEPYFSKSERLLGPVDRLVAIPHEIDSLERELRHIDLIINATSVGMKPSDPVLIPPSLLQPHHLVYDMVYSPPKTRLMSDVINEGGRAANGLSMLLWQGVYAYEFWFNETPSVNTMKSGLMDSFN